MQEIELKFQVPADRVEAITTAVRRLPAPVGQAQPLPLRAAYLDTPDNRLARHRMALRVRQEGPQWVQTFKGAGADAMTRLEENIDVTPPPQGQPVHADLSLHGAEVQSALQRALPGWRADADPQGRNLGLQPVYETRFERWQGQSEIDAGRVLVCLDLGAIHAGPLSAPLCELELELLEGHPRAVIELARQWVRAHGVWLDVQSKAMKGTRLARHAATGHPEPTRPVPLAHEAPAAGHGAPDWSSWLSGTLDACAGNAAELIRSADGGDEALTAWRQALGSVADHLPRSPWAGADSASRLVVRARAWHDELAHGGPKDALDQARALAQGQAMTEWALDVLELLTGD